MLIESKKKISYSIFTILQNESFDFEIQKNEKNQKNRKKNVFATKNIVNLNVFMWFQFFDYLIKFLIFRLKKK